MNNIIITSAPLFNFGVLDISISPDSIFTYAGSKGREYINKYGHINQNKIPDENLEKLSKFNKWISELVSQPEYNKFSIIGSGLQFKFGQTTIARQDINNSIDNCESEKLYYIIEQYINEIDPDQDFFQIEDTGTDIEITLTIEVHQYNTKKCFDKGDGVLFLNENLNLNIQFQGTMICGSTAADLPMAYISQDLNRNEFSTIFVTTDEKLIEIVKSSFSNSHIVSSPDILVTALYHFSNNQ